MTVIPMLDEIYKKVKEFGKEIYQAVKCEKCLYDSLGLQMLLALGIALPLVVETGNVAKSVGAGLLSSQVFRTLVYHPMSKLLDKDNGIDHRERYPYC